MPLLAQFILWFLKNSVAMKRLNFLLVVISLLFLSTANVSGQVTGFGLGLRGTSDGGGVSGKFFLDRNWAIEGQINGSQGSGYIDNDGASVVAVGLFEYNFILPDPSWRIFVGPGLHVGTWDRYDDGYYYSDSRKTGVQGIFGIDGIVGVEYVFKPVPIGIAMDLKPAVNFVRDVTFFPNNFFGVSARYYFGNIMARQHKPAPSS